MRQKPVLLFTAALLLAALVVAPVARAEDKPMAAPTPAAELSQLKYFTGTWACSGKTFATPMGPEHASVGTAKIDLVLGGHWYLFHYDETKSDVNPMPYHAAGFWGWDAADKTFVERCHDAFGGSCLATSKGWVGDVFTFEGPGGMGGQKMAVRDVFTKKSPTQLVHAGEMQGQDGTWMKTDEETCTKAGAKKK